MFVMIRGGGDIATGVALRLWRSGMDVCLCEIPAPTAIRRTVCFSEAVRRGEATVEDVTARLCEVEEIPDLLDQRTIPVLIDPEGETIPALAPDAVVDAILAKRNLGTTRDMAPVVIGAGPGFTAGQDVDAVIETMRGHHLGRVIRQGAALPNTGVPGVIAGYAAERVIHAPDSGAMHFVTDAAGKRIDIGALVRAGQMIARVGNTPVYATIDGVLRGLIRAGYPVTRGLKIADIDPRPEQAAFCDTVSDKARAIGGGVVEALLELARERQIKLL